MSVAFLIVSIIILLIAVFFFLKKPRGVEGISEDELIKLKTENDQLKVDVATQQGRVNGLVSEKESIISLMKEEKDRLINELTTERSKLDQANQSLESARSYYKAQQEKIQEQKAEVEQIRQNFQREFENIANKLLEEKSQKFAETNKNNLDVLLNPLKENIKLFEEKVEKVYKAESDERNVLKGEITKLMELNKQISEEANNLTKALKADTKKQGNWGEVILDRILEASGLIEGESYTKQGKGLNLVDEDGNRFQPDVIINLPDNKHIVIDSKVSLLAYERLVNCDTEEERESYVKQHILSIKGHINGLGGKNYQDLYGINSPDFVLLFVPIESSFVIAIQRDLELFEFAWNKKVVMVTPSTLLATLKTVASIWKQEQQTKNAIDIATKAGALYDKFVGFIADLKKIGDNLDRSRDAYNEAFGKLSTGSGNLVGRVEVLRKLGAKATKQIDQKFIEEE
ncbi:DNA recombination protein RmuC [Mucilaginibacter sp.]|jgi:DNA recombination protein RmuC|uniref:DNA recombination protein RmuC n=1 Tax=Mucilaginibacter sp. TaxID=1882438 RepID=UPI002CF6F09F|nr:DNA recombination protein RmuC [Mucilaginibacter sp.]HTI59971.1 DNA recombination protein RmuC [Mucilaginibacter sp.]